MLNHHESVRKGQVSSPVTQHTAMPSVSQGFTRRIDLMLYTIHKGFTKEAYNSHLQSHTQKNTKGPFIHVPEGWRTQVQVNGVELTGNPVQVLLGMLDGLCWKTEECWRLKELVMTKTELLCRSKKGGLPSPFPFYSIQATGRLVVPPASMVGFPSSMLG